MRGNHHLAVLVTAMLAVSAIYPTTARADGPTVTEVQETQPDRKMIGGGIVTLGLSYGVSAIVAAQSDRNGDKSLFIPVAGPWMDLTTRGGCDQSPCAHETANKVFLVIDGIVQAIGAIDIVAGLLTRESVVTTSASSPPQEVAKMTWQVTPAMLDHGYGMAAVGTF